MKIALRALLVMLFAFPALADPRDGWWWNPAEPGRGFFLERQGSAMFMSAYFYTADGLATWLVSNDAMPDPDAYQGRWLAFANGQPPVGRYRPPGPAVDAGAVAVRFHDDRHATLTSGGATIPIVRYEFRHGDEAALQPRTGWWFNPAKPGTGFSIEVQGDHIFIGAYMYDATGKPIWYVVDTLMESPGVVRAPLLRFAGGQTFDGPHRTPRAPIAVGFLEIEFASAEKAWVWGYDERTDEYVSHRLEPQFLAARPASGAPKRWVGGFDQTRVVKIRELDNVYTLDVGTMTWSQPLDRDDAGFPAHYKIEVGVATATARENDQVCTRQGTGEADLFYGDLTVNADGSYTGELMQGVSMQLEESCAFGSATGVRPLRRFDPLTFNFSGQLVDGRMIGNVTDPGLAGITLSGSWDFAPRF